MHIAVVPAWGIIFNVILTCVAANLTLGFKVTKISANNKPANCNVANTTYAHGETFKLDCKTQCVCENGRHACSSLCPKEQLPAPEDTISCRSPRLVEVPGHCCKMWLCENPTADVYATCHNSSTSPWTPCSRICGLGISTRFTTTTAGCNQLSNLRLCENRKCDKIDGDQTNEEEEEAEVERGIAAKENQKYLIKSKQWKNKLRRQQEQQHHKHDKHRQEHAEHAEHEHRIRKGHECRSIQRLGSARIRLGQCVSKKLYRPKICGRCHYNTKCCVPSLSTTIQVELLCPLNAIDPISFVQQQLTKGQQRQQRQQRLQRQQHPQYYAVSSVTSLWDTQSLDAIDQEYLQSHQIQIANKFIAVEWILKCECTNSDNCQRIVNTTMSSSSSRSSSDSNDHDNKENFNNKNVQNYNYFKLNYKQQQQQQHHERQQHINDTQHYDDGNDEDDDADNESNININKSHSHKKHTKDNDSHKYSNNNKDHDEQEEEEERTTSSSSSSSSYGGDVTTTSDEIQPDIIPYPPPPFSANKQTHKQNKSNNNNNSGNKKNTQTAKRINEKFQLEHSTQEQQQQQQRYYEQWLLQKYQPYQQEQQPESLAT